MPVHLEPLDHCVQIPYHFRCPISLELMRDPVTVCTGQTYDRSSIETWVATTDNVTCPVTRAPLTDFNLIPNHTLRRIIQDWCVANRSNGVDRIPTPKQPVDLGLVRSLLHRVSTGSILYGSRLSAVRRLRGLARDSEKNRAVIAANNACEVLVAVAFADVGRDESSELTHEALALLSMLALSESECIFLASDRKRIGYLVDLLFHSSIDVRISSAAMIEAVVSGIRSAELRAQIGDVEGVFEGIVGILNDPMASPTATKLGTKALFALCLEKQHRHRAVAAGAAEALIERLAEFDTCGCERALATVELLCRIPSGCAAFEEHAVTIPLLVKIILTVSDRATEYAAGALLSICSASERSQKEAAAGGVVSRLLVVVQSDCTARAKRKAQILLKLLRDSWLQQSSMSASDAYAGHDVVLF